MAVVKDAILSENVQAHYVYSAYGFWFRKTRTLIHNPIKARPERQTGTRTCYKCIERVARPCSIDIWQYGEINDGGCTEGSGSTGQRYENDLLFGRLGQWYFRHD
jgi:hypothetical protein